MGRVEVIFVVVIIVVLESILSRMFVMDCIVFALLLVLVSRVIKRVGSKIEIIRKLSELRWSMGFQIPIGYL